MTNDNLAVTFEVQRTHVLSEVEKIEYGELTGRQAVQTVSEGNRGTSSIRQYVMDRVGTMKLRSNKSEDISSVDVSGSYVQVPVYFHQAFFEYDIEELWACQEANINLDSTKAEVTVNAYEEMVNKIIWNGQADIGLTGLANNANVTISTTPSATKLSAMTAEAVVAYFVGGWNSIYLNSKQKVKANTLAICTADYLYLKQTAYAVVNGLTTQTLLERIIENTGISNKDVIVSNELTGAGVAGISRAIWYDRSPRRVKFNEPLPIEFGSTQQNLNSFQVPTVGKIGGVWIKYPNAFQYLDYEQN